MTIDDYVMQRNSLLLAAGDRGEKIAAECWVRLGVANRHIERISDGLLGQAVQVEREIENCINATGRWLYPYKDNSHET